MTIASYCHELLTQLGTLTLEQLGAAASAAGVTMSGNPQQAVRSALRDRAVPLPGDRWAAPLRLLEGRCLTTRRFSSYDLGPLELVCRHDRLPLAQGGFVHFSRYGAGLAFPDGFTNRQGLLALRILDGVLHVEEVDDSPELAARGAALAAHFPERPRYDYDLVRKGHVRLWALLEQDPALFREPTPPLSECLPSWKDLVEKEQTLREQQESFARYGYDRPSAWTTVELPGSMMLAAEDHAHSVGLPLDTWVTQLVERELSRARTVAAGDNIITFPHRLPGSA